VAQAKADAKSASRGTEEVIREKLASISEMVGGYDFADVVAAYCRGLRKDTIKLKADAIRWLAR